MIGYSYQMVGVRTMAVCDVDIDHADYMHCLETARQMVVRYADRVRDAYTAGDMTAVWDVCRYLNAAETEYAEMWQAAWFAGWVFLDATEAPSYTGKPWKPLITASVHFSLEQDRKQRKQDREWFRMIHWHKMTHDVLCHLTD